MKMLDEAGVGFIYFQGFEAFLESYSDLIDVIELEPQTIWYKQQGPESDSFRSDPTIIKYLNSINKPMLLHGVGFPVGGTIAPDQSQLPCLLQTINELRPLWFSEHLSFNTINNKRGGISNTNFLLPPIQTIEGITTAVNSIRSLARHLPVSMSIETGVNYLKPRKNEIPDGDFVAAISERADCPILLDLHNLMVNERNGRQTVKDFLKSLPFERINEIHVAGGFNYKNYYLDAHSGPISEELLQITRAVVRQLPNLKAIIFELLPEYLQFYPEQSFRKQFEALRRIWDDRGKVLKANLPVKINPSTRSTISPAEWEYTLGNLAIGNSLDTPLANELKQDKGLEIIKDLIIQFRASLVVSSLTLTCRLLRLTLGKQAFVTLLEEFWQEYPPELFASGNGESFAAFLESKEMEIAFLYEILAYEKASLQTLLDGITRKVELNFNPIPFIEALKNNSLPGHVEEGLFVVEITGEDDVKENKSLLSYQPAFHN